MENDKRWRLASCLLLILWLGATLCLMIADSWDESNGMVIFSDTSVSLAAKARLILTQSIGLYRPLATLLAAVVLHVIPNFDWNWRVLRVINTLMLLGSLWFLLDAAKEWRPLSWRDRALFGTAFLFSSSVLISATWFANIFDVVTLLMIAAGVWLVARGRSLSGGVVFGLAFFAKESAVLVLPFLLMLVAAGRVSWRAALRAAIPAVLLGATYFAIRSRIIPIGSAGDIHDFAARYYLPTLLNFSATFWRQHMKTPTYWGLFWLLLSLLALRRPRLIAAAAALIGACSVIYWGMFITFSGSRQISFNMFVGRLYLIPMTMLLFLLFIERKAIAIALLLIPIVLGSWVTVHDYIRFQRVYKRIYRVAKENRDKPLKVHYPEKPLHDPIRGIEIGDLPEAKVRVDTENGKLVY
jgi:hypothetical protein